MTHENKYKYLVLLLSAKEVHLYIYDKIKFEKIKLSSADNVVAYERDMPGRMGQFTDASNHKEVLINKFLHHIDLALGEILNQYPKVPLFVLGTKKITGHFNQLTKHAKAVTEYIDGNYNESSMQELKEVLAHPILALDFVKE
jgi:Bacterial archaeo-eukaryotic release factor family 3